VDDTERIQILLPDSFTDVMTAPAALDDGTQIPQIAASYDLAAWTGGWTVPGVYFAAYPFDDDPRSLYNEIKATDGCGVFGDYDHEGPYFFGLTQAGIRCGDQGTSDWQLVVANPLDQAFTAVVQWSTGPGHLGSPFRPKILGSFNGFGAPLTHEEAAAAIASPAPSPVLSTSEPSLTNVPPG
jgi:radical SAM superfamily enzyme with C-terminal helix-hairpin-helix motif